MRATQDVDVVPDPDPENLAKLDELLREPREINVLQGLPQVPRYEELKAQAKEVDLDGLAVQVCSFDHLLAMKRASDRARDHDDLEALEAAQNPDRDRD